MRDVKKGALSFVILMGIVSLFSDATYEGARSITGPFLEGLGASALVVGTVAGFGEFAGYSLRLIFGYVADKTRKYWTLAIVGYCVNLLSIPALSLVNQWGMASSLVIAERLGKAIRTPSRDAMLSYASCEVSRGLTFGLHEALDQIGAVAGPLLVTWILAKGGNYNSSFGFLIIPAMIALAVLFIARLIYPNPQHFEMSLAPELKSKGLPRAYKLYLIATAMVAMGYVDFPLIAYHIEHTSMVKPTWIPILYAIAMGVDAVAALIFGRWFDKGGLKVLFLAIAVSAFFPIFAFFGSFHLVILSMILWGIGMGVQESIMKATIANMVSSERRATAYGIFNTAFGICWFLGSALMGFLYEISIQALVAFSLLTQISALFVLWVIRKSTVFPSLST
ncbi:MAG: MFS transporter [Syntrophobacterales bacterium]|nr:MFS transporter [Syntrophobacterales bacterium]